MDLAAAITAGELPSDPDARDEKGVSALLLTFYLRRPDLRDRLLDAGATVGPLEAAALGDVERLRTADLSVRGADGFTPLHLAAFFGGADAVKAVLARGFDPGADSENTFGVRPLHSACAVSDQDAVRALLEAGANPNVHQQGGYTPLHTAAHNGNVALAELLLAHGADRTLTTEAGETPLDMAAGDDVKALLSR